MDKEIFHRYDDLSYAPPVDEFDNPMGAGSHELLHTTYRVIKRTAKGAWIDLGFGDKRFVLLTARKRYACPTQAEALESFIHRKERQATIYQSRLDKAENAQRMAFEMMMKLKIEIPESLGKIVSINGRIFRVPKQFDDR